MKNIITNLNNCIYRKLKTMSDKELEDTFLNSIENLFEKGFKSINECDKLTIDKCLFPLKELNDRGYKIKINLSKKDK